MILALMDGGYLRAAGVTPGGTVKYKMYEGNNNPVRWIPISWYNEFRDLLKKDSKGRLILNRKAVIALHGNSWIKKAYKRKLKQLRNGKQKSSECNALPAR